MGDHDFRAWVIIQLHSTSQKYSPSLRLTCIHLRKELLSRWASLCPELPFVYCLGWILGSHCFLQAGSVIWIFPSAGCLMYHNSLISLNISGKKILWSCWHFVLIHFLRFSYWKPSGSKVTTHACESSILGTECCNDSSTSVLHLLWFSRESLLDNGKKYFRGKKTRKITCCHSASLTLWFLGMAWNIRKILFWSFSGDVWRELVSFSKLFSF